MSSALHYFYREFSKERDKAEKSGAFRAKREEEAVDEAVKGYLDWIMHADLMEEDTAGETEDDDRPRLKRKPTIRDRSLGNGDGLDDADKKPKWWQRESFKQIRRSIRRYGIIHSSYYLHC